jgi:dienelactone hydrolase
MIFRRLWACVALVAFTVSSNADELPRRAKNSAEPLAGIETQFGELKTGDGYRLRTIITRPAGTTRRLPAVYFVAWLSCDSVELGKNVDGWGQMMRAIVQETGMVVVRVDKAGVGDSEGGPCSSLDYETELKHYRAGLTALYAHPWVDRDRVMVYGASMGANLAPLVAAGHKVRALAVWGGGAQSWFERQLGFERRALELGGKSGDVVDTRMRLLSRFYAAYLLDGIAPADIARRDAALGAAWSNVTGSEGATQFGRPVAFHQQAQRQAWAKAWAAIDAPVLALFGEYDWYESADGVRLIARVVNARRPGAAQARIVRGLDHHFMRYASAEDAFGDRGGQVGAAAVTSVLVPWLKQQAR